jgi:hypothetical protein
VLADRPETDAFIFTIAITSAGAASHNRPEDELINVSMTQGALFQARFLLFSSASRKPLRFTSRLIF